MVVNDTGDLSSPAVLPASLYGASFCDAFACVQKLSIAVFLSPGTGLATPISTARGRMDLRASTNVISPRRYFSLPAASIARCFTGSNLLNARILLALRPFPLPVTRRFRRPFGRGVVRGWNRNERKLLSDTIVPRMFSDSAVPRVSGTVGSVTAGGPFYCGLVRLPGSS